jgi:hypothetical protein
VRLLAAVRDELPAYGRGGISREDDAKDTEDRHQTPARHRSESDWLPLHPHLGAMMIEQARER